MTARNDGFSIVELLIAMLVLSVLLAVTLPNLLQARYHADDVVAKGYLYHVVQGVETKRIGNAKFSVPQSQSCAVLAGKAADPVSVSGCTYTSVLAQDSYTLTVESVTGETYFYNGNQISVLP